MPRADASVRRAAAPPRGRWILVAALLLASAGLLAPSTATPVRAAEDDLNLTTSAAYTIVPARRLVRVVVDVTARNNKPNVTSGGIVTRYFYEGARFAVQAEAKNVRATVGSTRLTASLKPDDGFAILEVRFRAALFFRQSVKIRVTYDLPGGAPRSVSDIRVGTAFATFVAWAFGDSGSVRVVVPAGFAAATTGSAVSRSSTDGRTILRAAGIADPAEWYLVVTADREGALTRERVDLVDGERLVIRAWPEDTEWQTRVRDVLTEGLPELVALIGLDWPVDDELSVHEVHTPLLEGYAGVFIVDEDKIEISEDLDDLTILHEASHAWFNGNLFQGRWINEGLADAYAADALAAIGIGGWTPRLVDPGDTSAVRLETWVHPGRITDDETNAREQYGYDASWTVMRALVKDIGPDRMREVLAAARDREIPYAGAGTPETVAGPADWRRFLDLLEEVGGSRTADAAFRRWVVRDAQLGILDKRVAARTAWAELVAAGGEWRAPMSVRMPLSMWDFVTATDRIAEANALLAQRDEIASLAAELGVQPPADLRTAYQTAGANLDPAEAIAARQLADLQALGTASAAVGEPRDLIVSLGLAGTTPEVDLAGAKAAFGAGAADTSARAAAVTAVLVGAPEVGRGRLLLGVAIAFAVLVVVLIVLVLVVRRRRRRRPIGPVFPSGLGLAAPSAASLASAAPSTAASPTPASAAIPTTSATAESTDSVPVGSPGPGSGTLADQSSGTPDEPSDATPASSTRPVTDAPGSPPPTGVDPS